MHLYLVMSHSPIRSLAQGQFNTGTGEVRDHAASPATNGRPAVPLSHTLSCLSEHTCDFWDKMCPTNLAEFLHLFMCVRIQFLRYVLHPEQRSSVLGPGLLHSIHGQPRVWDGSIAKRFDLLVQTAQRVPQSQSVGHSVKISTKVLHLDPITTVQNTICWIVRDHEVKCFTKLKG